MIVDDEPGLAARLCMLLAPEFEAEPALSAEEAHDLIESGERYAVVLSDLQMPGMDGTTLLARVQEMAPETTRMLFTGVYDMEAASRALAEGRIFRFLAKPCPFEELKEALEAGILRHRQKATRRLAQERMRFAHESVQGFNHLLEERLDQAQYAVVLALAKLAEERDNCTGRHLERVSAYCRELAIGLQEGGNYTDEVDARFIRDIERSAPLHDIGKVGIPDAILMKPGRLSDREWEVMRTHPLIGAQTLDAIIAANPGTSFLCMGRDVALGHHEYWDGNGYPHGLAGVEIPLAARILKVADCYDALTTARPYKEPWLHEEAIEHILTRGGTEFDPVVVEAFLRVESVIVRLRDQLADSGATAA